MLSSLSPSTIILGLIFLLFLLSFLWGVKKYGSFSGMMDHLFNPAVRLKEELEQGKITLEEYNRRIEQFAACY